MRSFLDPALFSSSCKPSGQEAIHFPLANTHLHLEPSHAHLDRELGAGPGPVLTSSWWHSWGDFQHPRAVGGVTGSGRAPRTGHKTGEQAGIFWTPASMFLWLPPLLAQEGLDGSGEH